MDAEIFSNPVSIQLSIVIPCLNEAETVGVCVLKARESLGRAGLSGEIIVADNGSTDGSDQIAENAGARIIRVNEKGYGFALRQGIAAAEGEWIIMGDADDSYDFSNLTPFLEELAKGNELVQGCRLSSGGGKIELGAMPWMHQWFGNPLFSFLVRRWFHAPIHDVYCGMRAFTKSFYQTLNLKCTGMEFATEMIIKASWSSTRIAEVPITLYKDGRQSRAPHLRTWHDGWRTLRFFLMYCPRWLYFAPGLLLVGLGVLGFFLGILNIRIVGLIADVHTLLFASLFLICGYESILFGIFTKIFAVREGFFPSDPKFERLFQFITLEKGLLAGAFLLVSGICLLAVALARWSPAIVVHLDYFSALKLTVPGATLAALGFQTILSSFLISILGLHRK